MRVHRCAYTRERIGGRRMERECASCLKLPTAAAAVWMERFCGARLMCIYTLVSWNIYCLFERSALPLWKIDLFTVTVFFPLSLSFPLPFFPILVSGIHNARFFYDIAMHFLKGLFSFLFFDFVNGSWPRWSTDLDHGQGFYYILAIVSYDSYRRKKNLISFLIFSWKGNNKISQAKNSNHRSLNDSKNYFIEQTTWLETLRVPNTSFKILPILFRSILRQLFSLVSWKWRLSEKETATLLILFAMNRRLK